MKYKITLILFFLLSVQSYSQKRVADKFFDKYAYPKAAELYELVVKRGDSTITTLSKLGDCYYNNSNATKASYWYNLASKQGKLNDEYIYKYAQSLKSLGKYKESDKLLSKIKINKNKSSSELYTYYEQLRKQNNDTIRVTNLDINTENSDFGAYEFNNKLYFSSAMNKKGKIYPWNNQPYLDLYEAVITKKDEKTDVIDEKPILSDVVNTNFHESNIAITKDGKTMYFTRNNLNKRKKLNYDKEGTSHLKIFKATLINGKWEKIIELPFNDKVYSNGHPALSNDDKTLYFTSNRPGGYGSTDIYKVAILNNGESYGEPVNLGAKINTSNREMFPFVASDNTFYFSSDGYKNLGFLDVFKSNFLNDKNAEVVNLGAPFNSGYDDFAYVVNESNRGYFSSNRPKGKGNDDIYQFESFKCVQFIKGITYDEKTKKILPKTNVQLVDIHGKVIDSLITGKNGKFQFKVNCKSDYKLRGFKKDYKDVVQNVSTTHIHKDSTTQDLYLKPLVIKKEIVINPIFFDYNKWNIRYDAAFELEKVVDVLKNNPKMIIKIESHTDSRGNDHYNLTLSDKRAKATRDYILSRGIARNRIFSAVGYGETQLINKCMNGVKCSNEEHQENRRSKFIITSN